MKRVVVLLSLVVTASSVAAEKSVVFNDPRLKAAVEVQLHVSNPTPADMIKLFYLVANERGITDLTGLEYAVNLSTLNLGYNSVSNLSTLSGLVNLTRLYLDGNALPDVSALGALKKLQFLELTGNEIAAVAPLGGCVQLTELHLGSNRIQDVAPLSGLSRLTCLDLSDNEIVDTSALAALTGLTELSLSYNQIADISPLSRLTKLAVLDLALNQLTDITPLAGLTSLSRLRLGNNRIRDIAPLLKLTHLTLLSIEYDNPLAPAAYCVYIPRLEQNNPGLQFFYDRLPRRAPGDCTGDCRMNLLDLATLAASWLRAGPDLIPPDFSSNYVVDFPDLSILADNWLGLVEIREFRLDASPGWTIQGQWQFGPPQGLGGLVYGYPDPNAGHTGVNVYGVNPAGDYAGTPGQPYYLTTDPIDCRGFRNVTLAFARQLNTDDPSRVRSTLEVSTNGTSWTTIWQHSAPTPLTDSQWQQLSYDIRSIADGRPEVYLRWGYEVLKGARPYSGWNLDDIVLWGTR